jgi:hypothetical protein
MKLNQNTKNSITLIELKDIAELLLTLKLKNYLPNILKKYLLNILKKKVKDLAVDHFEDFAK